MTPSRKRNGSTDLTRTLLKVVRRKKECDIDELVQGCAAYTWNQVFIEVDRLTRTGELRLRYKDEGEYKVSLPLAA